MLRFSLGTRVVLAVSDAERDYLKTGIFSHFGREAIKFQKESSGNLFELQVPGTFFLAISIELEIISCFETAPSLLFLIYL